MAEYTIPFNRSAPVGRELEYISQALLTGQIAGDQTFSRKCQQVLEQALGVRRALMATSCTHVVRNKDRDGSNTAKRIRPLNAVGERWWIPDL